MGLFEGTDVAVNLRPADEPGTSREYVFTLSDIDSLKRAQAEASSRGARLADFAQFAGVGVCRIINSSNIFVNFGKSTSTCACTSFTSTFGFSFSVHVSVSP